jgi:hypothetical protein
VDIALSRCEASEVPPPTLQDEDTIDQTITQEAHYIYMYPNPVCETHNWLERLGENIQTKPTSFLRKLQDQVVKNRCYSDVCIAH